MTQKLLLVGWDGADWEIAAPLMKAGQMPVLSRLVKGGTSGDLTSFKPYLSPVLWTTFATGHDPDKHGVHGFAEVDPLSGKVQAIGSQSRRVKALWNLVSEQGGTAGVVGWMGSFPAESIHGAYVADEFAHPPDDPAAEWPLTPGSVYPPSLAEELADLRLRPADVDPGLLGLFVPELHERGLEQDPRLAQLMRRLAQLYTLHNASIALVSRDQPDFFAIYFHFIDLICHEFLVFHPPRHPEVSLGEYARYQEVVSAAYRVQDALLGDLLAHCAPETGVMLVSDHGFKTGADRPRRELNHQADLVDWHGRTGIAVAHGPTVAAGSRFRGVRPQDIAPTLLAWMDMPRSEDMPGRVLDEMFATLPEKQTIRSWENHPPVVAAPPSVAVSPSESEQERLVRRFIELGYLEPAVLQKSDGAKRMIAQNEAGLGVALSDLGRKIDALPLLHAAALEDPESIASSMELTFCLLDLGLPDEAERAAAPMLDLDPKGPRVILLRAQLLIARETYPEALALLERIEEPELQEDKLRLYRVVLLRSGNFEEARLAFAKEVERRPNLPLPLLGYAHSCLMMGDYAEAVAAAKRALELDCSSAFAIKTHKTALWCLTTGASLPNRAWDEITTEISQKKKLREEYQERERRFHEQRRAQRESIVPAAVPSRDRKPILVVSGAPRSGTSMMMRMLSMAGLPTLTDGLRVADASNPLGYFEWESVKKIAGDPQSIGKAEGKVLKVVSALLPHLPAGWNYEVIFMRRDTDAILRSQEEMVARLGGASVKLAAEELEQHLQATLEALRQRPDVRLLEIDYDGLIDQPEEIVQQLIDFVGPERLRRVAALRSSIRADLRHHAPSTRQVYVGS
jgi:predicted AlkP superfamily phosphohydrolase/phosphomutase/tetratricopeptide (TPR) repeat protein